VVGKDRRGGVRIRRVADRDVRLVGDVGIADEIVSDGLAAIAAATQDKILVGCVAVGVRSKRQAGLAAGSAIDAIGGIDTGQSLCIRHSPVHANGDRDRQQGPLKNPAGTAALAGFALALLELAHRYPGAKGFVPNTSIGLIH
jgi:hypothetical protein